MKIAAFVPLKLNSRRLPNKNFLRLGERPLSYHVFESLTRVPEINGGVYCYTSQPQVLKLLPSSVELLMRPPRLDGDDVRANELFRYAVENIDADLIVLCHATGPFIKPDSISKGVSSIISDDYDCAFSVMRHQTYCWFEGAPLNYVTCNMDQTQNLTPVFSETSGFYAFRKADYLESNTRIGVRPFLVEVDFKEAVDIDEPSDFALASLLISHDPDKVLYSTDRFFIDLANNGFQYGGVKHISFDLDGVLIDSLAVMESAWADAMKKISLNVSFENYKKYIGMPFDEILRHLGFDEKKSLIISEVYNLSSRANIDKIKIFDGVLDALKRLRQAGFLISLVTSKNRIRTDEIVNGILNQECFDQVITPEDVALGRGKPCPDPILLACLKLGVDPGNSIYVGDMSSDRESALRAGVHFIHANWGFSDFSQAKDIWFNTIGDLVDFICDAVTKSGK